MNYCNAEENKEHILKLIDWLYNEVKMSGGDGDAIWCSRYFDLKDIKLILEEYNSKLNYPFEISLEKDIILWGTGQEWAIITNSILIFNSQPEWIQAKIYW